jgi:hypothetical protein
LAYYENTLDIQASVALNCTGLSESVIDGWKLIVMGLMADLSNFGIEEIDPCYEKMARSVCINSR